MDYERQTAVCVPQVPLWKAFHNGQKPTFSGVERNVRFMLEEDISLQVAKRRVQPVSVYPTFWECRFVFATTYTIDRFIEIGSCDPLFTLRLARKVTVLTRAGH